MLELQIREASRANAGLLLPLSEFLSRIEQHRPQLLQERLTLRSGAEAAGGPVTYAAERAASANDIEVSAELLAALRAGAETFMDATLVSDDGTEFGVFDSTFLFVRGSRELLDALLPAFAEARIESVRD